MRTANPTALAALLLLGACRPGAAPAVEERVDAGDAGHDAVTVLGDDFDGSALDQRWSVFGGDTFRHTVEDGALHLEPTQNVVWYLADRGPALLQLVRGGFTVTTRVRARRKSNPALPPGHDFQFGGIIARDPRSDRSGAKENYVFSVVGYRGNYLAAETKSTRDDHSDVAGPPWPSGDAELRICRLGATYRLYDRPIGNHRWHHAITYTRGDLPQELQVGPIAYTMTDHPDLRASFEWIRFAAASTEADCERE